MSFIIVLSVLGREGSGREGRLPFSRNTKLPEHT